MSRVRVPSPAFTKAVRSYPQGAVIGSLSAVRSSAQFEVIVVKPARVAQLVEHTLGKGEVIGSIPIASSGVKEWQGAALVWFGTE